MTIRAGAFSLSSAFRPEERRAGSGAGEAGTPSDAQVLALAREAPAEALEVLYAAYRARIYGFLLRLVADPDIADDVTQEAFTKAYRALASLTPQHRILPWLYRIAQNSAIDHLRRRRRFTWLPLGALTGTTAEPPAPDEHGRVADRQELQRTLRSLPPENSAALLLHALEGYSYAEIAEIQGCSLTAVRSRIARARASFREAYGSGGTRQTD